VSAAAKRRWVVTGAGGQVGRGLVEQLRASSRHAVAAAFARADLDVTDAGAVDRVLAAVPGGPPDVVANAAAMTHVDRCESERDAAFAANAVAPGLLAAWCRGAGAQLVHYSTDYVFDGRATQPYREDDATHPQSVYGHTKLEGERRVFASLPGAIVVRTAWVFGPGRNFVRTMVHAAARSAAEGGPGLRVVDDQRGSPTYSADVAAASIALVESGGSGLYHASNAGIATWWQVARAAVDAYGRAFGHPAISIAKLRTEEYPVPAPRPAWSVLDTRRLAAAGISMRPWQDALGAYLDSDASPLRELGASK
jgi:dTDP-4-dehydrorhamnose reductase